MSKGFNLSSKDLRQSPNPAWRVAAGGPAELPKPRKKRFTGDHSQKKAWVREMRALPGRFFVTGRIPNWLNCLMHHHAKAKIAKSQQAVAFMETKLCWGIIPPTPPLLVTLTRYGPQVLDDDGLAASLKHYRDGVALALGIDDGETARLRFKNVQEQAKFHGLRIHIEPITKEGPHV